MEMLDNSPDDLLDQVLDGPLEEAPRTPANLIARLAGLMKDFPAYASYLRTSRDAVVGTLSDAGTHGLILAALEDGANTYSDLMAETGFSASKLHRHLNQLISLGLVYMTEEPARMAIGHDGQRRPIKRRKLYFLTEKNELPSEK
jgi:hypothetical protein